MAAVDQIRLSGTIFLPNANGDAPILVSLRHCELLEMDFATYLPLAPEKPKPLDNHEWYNKPVLSRWLLPQRSPTAELSSDLPLTHQAVLADLSQPECEEAKELRLLFSSDIAIISSIIRDEERAKLLFNVVEAAVKNLLDEAGNVVLNQG